MKDDDNPNPAIELTNLCVCELHMSSLQVQRNDIFKKPTVSCVYYTTVL